MTTSDFGADIFDGEDRPLPPPPSPAVGDHADAAEKPAETRAPPDENEPEPEPAARGRRRRSKTSRGEDAPPGPRRRPRKAAEPAEPEIESPVEAADEPEAEAVPAPAGPAPAEDDEPAWFDFGPAGKAARAVDDEMTDIAPGPGLGAAGLYDPDDEARGPDDGEREPDQEPRGEDRDDPGQDEPEPSWEGGLDERERPAGTESDPAGPRRRRRRRSRGRRGAEENGGAPAPPPSRPARGEDSAPARRHSRVGPNDVLRHLSVATTGGQRIAVMVDVERLVEDARGQGGEVAYGNLLRHLASRRHLIRAVAYGSRRLADSLGATLVGSGFEFHTIDDRSQRAVALTVEALALAPRVDGIVLVPAAADLEPLAAALRAAGVRVEWASFATGDRGDDLSRQFRHDLGRECIFVP